MRDRDALASIIADSINKTGAEKSAYFLDSDESPTDISD